MTTSEQPVFGLSDLRRVELTEPHARVLAAANEDSQGPSEWRARKLVEATEVIALSQIAPRLSVLGIDMRTELKLLVRMRCPVPCKPPGSDDIDIAPFADIALRYPEELLRGPVPGYSLAQLVAPRFGWHPNLGYDPAQRICFGVRIARGFPLKEVILACHAALTLQAVTLDPNDHAGLLNRAASVWWCANRDRIPLSRVPFLGDEDVDLQGEGR